MAAALQEGGSSERKPGHLAQDPDSIISPSFYWSEQVSDMRGEGLPSCLSHVTLTSLGPDDSVTSGPLVKKTVFCVSHDTQGSLTVN